MAPLTMGRWTSFPPISIHTLMAALTMGRWHSFPHIWIQPRSSTFFVHPITLIGTFETHHYIDFSALNPIESIALLKIKNKPFPLLRCFVMSLGVISYCPLFVRNHHAPGGDWRQSGGISGWVLAYDCVHSW